MALRNPAIQEPLEVQHPGFEGLGDVDEPLQYRSRSIREVAP